MLRRDRQTESRQRQAERDRDRQAETRETKTCRHTGRQTDRYR